VEAINIVMTVYAHVTLDSLELIVISELVPMIALDMDTASMDHATVVQVGLAMIAL